MIDFQHIKSKIWTLPDRVPGFAGKYRRRWEWEANKITGFRRIYPHKLITIRRTTSLLNLY